MKIISAFLFLFSFVLISVMSWGQVSFAQHGDVFPGSDNGDTFPGIDNGDEPGGLAIKNPLEADTITELFTAIIDILMVFAVPLIVFFIIYAGFLYVTAQGNENTIQKAHTALLYALIGGVIILGAKVLITVIGGTVETFYDS